MESLRDLLDKEMGKHSFNKGLFNEFSRQLGGQIRSLLYIGIHLPLYDPLYGQLYTMLYNQVASDLENE